MPNDNNVPLTVPVFESKLPPEFTVGLDDRTRYLYHSLEKLGQCQTWLVNRAVIDAGTLSEIKTQVERTNGRTTKNEEEIKEIRAAQRETTAIQEAAAPAIKVINFGITLAKSKVFWIAMIIFLAATIPWLMAHWHVILSGLLAP